MLVEYLKIENFRNYASLELELQPGVTVLFGNNGQGKTNILEAIYLCTCASSHRTSRDKELIRMGESDYRVQLQFTDSRERQQEIIIQYLEAIAHEPLRSKNQRLVWHNGLRLERIGHLMGLFNAVIFAPEDLRMIKEGPQNRRRFLDLLISQVKPAYFLLLQQFNVILHQRNTLLKKLRDQNWCPPSTHNLPDTDSLPDFQAVELTTWDESFAKVAAELIEIRYEISEQLSLFAAEVHQKIVGKDENLSVRYKTISGLSFESDDNCRQNNSEIIFKTLRENWADDIRRGSTCIGPHRDDLLIQLDKLSMRIYGSQGQQRTAVLALKMAELKIIEAYTKQRPILLLDDVMSELDRGRRESLVDSIRDYQVLITCTEAEMVGEQIKELESALPIHYFEVNEGSVKPWYK